MRAWDTPTVPSLPGSAPLPQIFDTSTGTVVQLQEPQHAGLYVCGITPYDATHMGHASTYVAFDVLNRAWRDAGVHEVTDHTAASTPQSRASSSRASRAHGTPTPEASS